MTATENFTNTFKNNMNAVLTKAVMELPTSKFYLVTVNEVEQECCGDYRRVWQLAICSDLREATDIAIDYFKKEVNYSSGEEFGYGVKVDGRGVQFFSNFREGWNSSSVRVRVISKHHLLEILRTRCWDYRI